jgi:MoaA/NifB/PqqE/SkfB family radical SAM enzyme
MDASNLAVAIIIGWENMRIKVGTLFHTWGRILQGRVPTLSLEITRECPLRCPGCYAYEDAHLGPDAVNLRSLADFKGEELIARVLRLVDEYKPMHLSIVGGDPLVRYRELEVLLPQLVKRAKVQVVTSAFRPIPAAWAALPNLQISVSIDGLQPEHDVRRAPATYERILRNIEGQHATVHCTITSAMAQREGYIEEFVDFWSANPNVEKIWMSIFTPQRGAENAEILSAEERGSVVKTLLHLRESRPKLDMPALVIREFLRPPDSPEKCVFAKTTRSISADFKTLVEPCQFGGDPDCSQCGCLASMGMAALGNHKLVGSFTVGDILWTSQAVGGYVQRTSNWLREPIGSDQGSSGSGGYRRISGAKDLLKVLR